MNEANASMNEAKASMNEAKANIVRECASAAHRGTIAFPEVIARLVGIGTERYRTDLCRSEHTYYFPDGAALVAPLGEAPGPIAATFSADGVEAAVRASQRGEIRYSEFLQRIRAAGCVEYVVHLTGRRVCYFGRHGDVHHEPFPSAPRP